MKSKSTKFFCLFVVFLLAIGLFACSDNSGDISEPSENPPPPGASGEFARFGYLDVPNGDWDWAAYDQLFDRSYTHLILSVMRPQTDGSIINVDAMIDFDDSLIARAKENGIKVLASIGASVTPFSTFVAIANAPVFRERFINNVLQIIHDKYLDGVDLNFEGQHEGITEGELAAVNDLAYLTAKAVKEKDASNIVTAALAAAYFLPMGFECSFINSDLVDYAHHMSYNFSFGAAAAANGPWRAPGEEIWLYNETKPIERSVYGALKYLVDEGCKVEKLTGGIPFFSAQLNLWDQIRDKADWASIDLHPDHLEKLPGGQLPYDWMNDPEAVAAKAAAYREFGLGGVMVWQVGQEGSTGDLSRALFKAATDIN